MILDVAIIVILILFGLRSYRNGLGGELLGTIGWIITILIALRFSSQLGDYLSNQFPQIHTLSSYLSFVIILVIIRLLLIGSARLIHEDRKGAFNFIFRLTSTAFGFIKGAFFSSIILLLLSISSIQPNVDKLAKNSKTYFSMKIFAIKTVDIIIDIAPEVYSIYVDLAEKSDRNESEKVSDPHSEKKIEKNDAPKSNDVQQMEEFDEDAVR